jgi:hypothetical protein
VEVELVAGEPREAKTTIKMESEIGHPRPGVSLVIRIPSWAGEDLLVYLRGEKTSGCAGRAAPGVAATFRGTSKSKVTGGKQISALHAW